jgi:hypothetical protein
LPSDPPALDHLLSSFFGEDRAADPDTSQIAFGFYKQSASTFYLRDTNTGVVVDITFRFGPAGAWWTPVAGSWIM